MIKPKILFILSFFFLWGCQQEQDETLSISISLTGKSRTDNDQLAIHQYGSRDVLDSVSLSSNSTNTYSIEFPNKHTDAFYVTLNGNRVKNSTFLANHEDVSIEIHQTEGKDYLTETTITSPGLEQNQLNEYKQFIQPFQSKIDQLEREYYTRKEKGEAYTKEERKEFDNQYDEAFNQFEQKAWDYVRKNKNLASLLILNSNLKYTSTFNDVQQLMTSLKEQYESSSLYQSTIEFRDQLERTDYGKVAPNFSLPNPDGKMISINDFRGKYLLIDFWASWCGPCRKENPNLVKTYNRFKEKNFEILGVSYDYPGSREKWLKAVNDDQLTWPQVSDLNGWKTETTKLYGISGIPTQYLLDPDGKIIAKSLELVNGGLEKKLEELGL